MHCLSCWEVFKCEWFHSCASGISQLSHLGCVWENKIGDMFFHMKISGQENLVYPCIFGCSLTCQTWGQVVGAAEEWTGFYCLLSDRMVKCNSPGVPLSPAPAPDVLEPTRCSRDSAAAWSEALCTYVQLKVCWIPNGAAWTNISEAVLAEAKQKWSSKKIMHFVATKQNCCGIPLCNAGGSSVGEGEGERMRGRWCSA